MSEFTKCNYCTLKSIKKRAKEKGSKVVVKGQSVYVVPKGEEIDMDKHCVAWLMDLTNHCCC